MSDQSQSGAAGKAMKDLKAVGDAVGQVGQQARQAGGQALDHAQDVAQDAQARATSLTSEVKEHAASIAQTQKDGLAERLEDVAHAVHRAGEQLEGHQDWAARLVERGADELVTLSDTLRKNDLRSLMDNLQDLAKRQPALFTGATLAAGFALARVGRVAVAGALRAEPPQGSGASS